MIPREIGRIAVEYFGYMAENFPVMCSSDEFHFFPRVKESLLYLDRLESLDRQKIKEALSRVKRLLEEVESLPTPSADPDAEIDMRLLKQSMRTFLREFGDAAVWQVNPNLYIKIFLLGIDELLSRLKLAKAERQSALRARVESGGRLLEEARANLKEVPGLHKITALEIIDASVHYLKTDLPQLLEPELIAKAVSSLELFRAFLKRKPSHHRFLKDAAMLEDLLKTNYSYSRRSPEEIFDIAQQEYNSTLEDMGKGWRKKLSNYYPRVKDPGALIKIYSDQIQGLKEFLIENEVVTVPESGRILVKPTPLYLIPVRQTASYSSPVTADRREEALFYITIPRTPGNIHNEYIFVTAHETYPGHHLLDSKRRGLENNIRRNIESALFYEGWASYAERLIDNLGYVKDPRQRLVGLKRQAWRAIRTMLDTGLRIKRFTLEDAGKALRKLGYQSRLVESMVKHYALTYGYQLCYTIGKFEFDSLRERFMPRLGMKRFHDLALGSGEIPFDLIEKKLEKACEN